MRRFLLLCVDFDETITRRDTISLLLQLSSCSAMCQQQLVTQYVDEMSEFLEAYNAKWELCTSVTRGVDAVGLHAFLKGYAATDLRSLERVVKSRALEGICHCDVAQAASTVPIRPHCAETLAAVDEWTVISANWSTRLVSSVLTQSGISIAPLDTAAIVGNEMHVDAHGVTTGAIDVKVQSPADKARCVKAARLKRAEMQPTVMYVGDSANDVLAMLEADVGVWLVVDSTSLSLLGRLLRAYRVDVRPLMTCSSIAECVATTSRRPTVFTMTDWAQLKELVEKAHSE